MEKDSNENWLSPHKPYSIAHRGASAYYQENTIESFFFAAKIGADFWEVDVQITKDKYLVVFHDHFPYFPYYQYSHCIIKPMQK